MAAKKNATKTTDSITPATNDSVKPVAKKATKAAKKAATPVQPEAAELSLSDSAPTHAATAAAPVATPQAKKSATKPSLDSIARGAYLNYRRRVEQGLPGDSDGDWLEAERQAAQAG
jgi:hypothetical protein